MRRWEWDESEVAMAAAAASAVLVHLVQLHRDPYSAAAALRKKTIL